MDVGKSVQIEIIYSTAEYMSLPPNSMRAVAVWNLHSNPFSSHDFNIKIS